MKRILLLYPYYWPHYKAGGPIQSLFNFVSFFKARWEFFVISRDRDIDGDRMPDLITVGKWVKGPNGENIRFVSKISPLLIFRVVKDVNPDIIFINGIFNWSTTIPGIICGRFFRKRIVISPRGMLQEWALQRGYWKKRFYLFFLRLLVTSKVVWHATDSKERRDIASRISLSASVRVVGNIPRNIAVQSDVCFPDVRGKIRLVFLSLISPNKNLHFAIDAVNRFSLNFTLDIYGPIIDPSYWNLCINKISDNGAISYKGAIPAWNVPDLISQYHFLILPTRGENFGHAIFDALSSGVPVIVSPNTPWKELDCSRAGFYIDENLPESISQVFYHILNMAPNAYQSYRTGSRSYAQKYLDLSNFESGYGFLEN